MEKSCDQTQQTQQPRKPLAAEGALAGRRWCYRQTRRPSLSRKAMQRLHWCGKRPFGCEKRSIHQDRLGTNIDRLRKKRLFLQAVLNVSSVNSHSELEPNVLMNTIVQSVDVVIGAGNPAAVGVRMRGAQGSGLEDVGVFAAADAFAGVSGVSGSGGAHSNITVVGARFGVDARDTQPSASLTNVRLINQSCAALIHEGLETLTMAGVFVGVNENAEPGAAAISSGSPSATASGSKRPSLPGLPLRGWCAPLLSPVTNVQQSAYIAGNATRLFCATYILNKSIIVPRQARDKHRESCTQNRQRVELLQGHSRLSTLGLSAVAATAAPHVSPWRGAGTHICEGLWSSAFTRS